jgi:hypothetical protein
MGKRKRKEESKKIIEVVQSDQRMTESVGNNENLNDFGSNVI